MRRRQFLRYSLMGSAVLAGAPAAWAAGWDPSRKSLHAQKKFAPINYGLLKVNHSAPPIVADKKGWFKEAGLDVRVSLFTTGKPLMEGLAAGQLDAVAGGTVPAMLGIARGLKAQAIMGIHLRGTSVVARPEIKSAGDLKGRRIGIPAKGTTAHFVLIAALWAAGLNPDDVKILEIRDPLNIKISLQKGEIDAASNWSPFSNELELMGFRVLSHVQDVWGGDYQEDVVLMDMSFLQQHPETVRKFIDVHMSAFLWVIDPKNLDELATMTNQLSGVSMEAERRSLQLPTIVFTPEINLRDLENQGVFLVKTGLLEKERVPTRDRYVNEEFYRYALEAWRKAKAMAKTG